MSIGTAIHEFLEIKDLGMFLQEPKVNKRTNKGKEELQEFYDSNSDTDKKIVTTEIYEQLMNVHFCNSVELHFISGFFTERIPSCENCSFNTR